MARTYKRDSKGRFAGGGGSSSGGKRRTAAKSKTPRNTDPDKVQGKLSGGLASWQRADRIANWVRKPGEGWVRNKPSMAKKASTKQERQERLAYWVRKPGEGWVRNR